MCTYPLRWVIWGQEVWCLLIKLYWGNGYGDMVMKLPISSGKLSSQNMVRVKGGGVLMFARGLMGVASGEALIKGGRSFLSICLL